MHSTLLTNRRQQQLRQNNFDTNRERTGVIAITTNKTNNVTHENCA